MNGLLKYIMILYYLSFAIFSSIAQDASNATYIKAGKLFDSEKGTILSDYIIKIERNRIIEVGKNILIPADAKTIDLSEYTVLPGLIDGHTHLMTLDNLNDDTPMADKLLFEGDALRVL